MPVDPSAQIAPTARVHPDAHIGAGVVVGDFSLIERDVSIGAETILDPYVVREALDHFLGQRNQNLLRNESSAPILSTSTSPESAVTCASATATSFASITPSRAGPRRNRKPSSATGTIS